ncbi:MAG: chromosomal replication initiator protein DnaA [Myxococcaceae bacterium]|nr:chromosomal replication initiator protein DnaA [Myxococcaceae bacterium]MBH2005741.1 chromosomal replication initiator protein DnaA [Myxococcaceae bacterium]
MVAIQEFETQPADAFSETLQILKRRLSLFVWQGFFEPLHFVSLEHNTLTVSAPSSFHRDWIQNHYLVELQESAAQGFHRSIAVKIIEQATKAQNSSFGASQTPSSLPQSISPLKAPRLGFETNQAPIILESSLLNPNHTLDSFVMGPSNQMAYTACDAVAREPGAQYSPLFLFGPVGIGKTHLIQGIGLYALQKNPNARILYMSAEQWVNAYIFAIREKRFDAFRKKFRNDCDILLIDDIQFLAGKDASQDEFFHTFNCLHQAHKQIVVTSDKYPHEIEGLEERLQTRLSWGLIADIRPPEIETRMAILDRKAKSCGFELPKEVCHYLASQITTSVRELEGALIRLTAFLSVTKSQLTVQAAKEYLSPVFRRSTGALSAEKICDHVAAYYDLKSVELKGQSRQRQVTLARQIAMTLCRSMMAFSLPEIGRFFGGRDHTTALSSIRKINEMKESDISLQTVLSKLEKSLLESC